jgi:hypothetical protein
MNNEENVTRRFNSEVIRDYCGTLWNQLDEYDWDPYIYTVYLCVLPDAIDTLVRCYHFNISGKNVKTGKDTIYKILVKELEDVIPLDDTKWTTLQTQKAVYDVVFGIKYLDLGERLKFTCKSILDSDYWKSLEYCHKNVQGDMQKILIKAINGYKPYKLDMNSFTPYFERFGV